ncbi:MAG: TylF/MycF/NovP-related O-methyltransferase [Candidatus Saccharibacteria bacterium]|nr:class I SAM-dependent methyltransferase [Candidatus Saccharibacteria bacterium]MDO4986880.1 TylF/MycF/NovP-related O-methyltransferase [Candidatus Saccharibacteria bacterium]
MKHHADAPKQVSERETQKILELAEKSLEVEGDFVELGCYRGDTSVQLERLLEKHGFIGKHLENGEYQPPEKRLFIYDSFEGLPRRVQQDGSAAGTEFKEGELLVTKREVVEKFKRFGLKLPIIKKGFFENLDPATDLPAKISFAFLDGDLYTSIRTSLKLVTPKLAKGATLIIHDYNNPQLQGVAKAVDEWRNSRDFQIFETCAIIMI